MTFKLAFRNVLRNKRRTFLTALLIGVGLGVLILYDGFVQGMTEAMVRSATGSFLGEAQVHAEGFRKDRDVEKVVANWPAVSKALSQDPLVKAHAGRVIANGMLSSAANVSSVAIFGIDPASELGVSQLKNVVREGASLTGSSDTEILIGRRLAKLLEVGLGDRVVLTVAQAKSGELSQELFRVSGIFAFKTREMDQAVVFIARTRAQGLLRLPGQVHEVAFSFYDSAKANDETLPLWQELKKGGNEALGWRALMPSMAAMMDMSRYGTTITALILFAIISFGVINSLFMSIYERMFEFGVLKAIGTRPWQLARLVVVEAVTIGFISIVVGVVLGGAATAWFRVHGLDYSDMEYAGVAARDPIRTVVHTYQFVLYPVYVIALTVIASLYPAIHAARLVPTEAMRKSL